MPSEVWAIFNDEGELLAVFTSDKAALKYRLSLPHPGRARKVRLDPEPEE